MNSSEKLKLFYIAGILLFIVVNAHAIAWTCNTFILLAKTAYFGKITAGIRISGGCRLFHDSWCCQYLFNKKDQ